MKILFDFDGVLTEQSEEARRVKELFREKLISTARINPHEIDILLEDAEKALRANPSHYGWVVNDRISAFADEDLFVWNHGIAAYFDEQARSGSAAHRELLELMRPDAIVCFNDVANLAFQQMAAETQRGQMHPLESSSVQVLGDLLKSGHEVVIVSNSNTQRILNLLDRSGLSAADHLENPTSSFRVRGGAKKNMLSEDSKNSKYSMPVGDYHVCVSRPNYEQVLREEKPQAVIGDVFSLDLSLPLHLARSGESDFHGMKLFLRTRDYTPLWSKEFMRGAQESTASLALLDRLEDLPAAIA